MTWWQWFLIVPAIWIVGGLIASRIVLFRITDDKGKPKSYRAVREGREVLVDYELFVGWPLVWGVLWPFMVTVCAIGIGFYILTVKVPRAVLSPFLGWWYTKPSARKAQRFAKLQGET